MTQTNKEWHIGDTVSNEDIEDAVAWCNARGDAYPKQTSYDTATGRETWVLTLSEQPAPPTLEEAKAEKYAENNSKAEQAREGQAFTVTIDGTTLSFITDRKTQQDLQTALTFLQAGMQSYQWIDEQGVSFNFTSAQQIIQVSTVFMEKANVYSTWLTFKNMIDDAETVEEVRQIVIDYGVNE